MTKTAATGAMIAMVAPLAVSAAAQNPEYISWMFAGTEEVLEQAMAEYEAAAAAEPSLDTGKDTKPDDSEYGELGW